MDVLGLDISSSTIGFSVLQYTTDASTISLQNYGYIKPDKDGDIEPRLDSAIKEIIKIYKKYKPDVIVVEEITKFMKGGSQANTIIMLATFNRTISYELYKISKKQIHRLMPATIRKEIKEYLGLKNKLDKEGVYEEVKKRFNNLAIETYIPSRGKNKGKVVEKEENRDITDAVAVAWSWIIRDSNAISKI